MSEYYDYLKNLSNCPQYTKIGILGAIFGFISIFYTNILPVSGLFNGTLIYSLFLFSSGYILLTYPMILGFIGAIFSWKKLKAGIFLIGFSFLWFVLAFSFYYHFVNITAFYLSIISSLLFLITLYSALIFIPNFEKETKNYGIILIILSFLAIITSIALPLVNMSINFSAQGIFSFVEYIASNNLAPLLFLITGFLLIKKDNS